MKTIFTKRNLILAVLFLSAYFVRLTFISKGPFHYDTLDLVITAQKTFLTHVLHYEHGTGYPLTVIIGSFFIFVFRLLGIADPIYCVNFMSVVFGALGVISLYSLVEKLFDSRTAVFSAILFTAFAPHIAISTFGKSLTPGILFSIVSAIYMLCYIEKQETKHLVFGAVFLGFCAAARLSDALIALPIIILYFSYQKIDKKVFRNFIVFIFIALITGGLYYLPMFFEKGFKSFITVLSSKDQSAFLGIFSYVAKASWGWVYDVFKLDGILLALAGFVVMAVKKERRPCLFLLAWFLVMQLYYGSVSSSGLRYLVIAWIPLLVAQGYFLGGFRGRGFFAVVILLLGIILFNFFAYARVFEFRHERSLQAEFAAWVARKTPEDAIILAMDENIFIEYYGRRKTMTRPVSNDTKVVAKFLDGTLAGLFKEKKNVYMISTAFVYDRKHVFRKELLSRYDLVLLGQRRNEDWHHSLLENGFITEKLFQIVEKKR